VCSVAEALNLHRSCCRAVRPPLLPSPLADAVLSNHNSGWRVVAHHTGTPGGALADKIQLGVLLGAGSYGRVYKGRWRGRDVAVKVMTHDMPAAERVANEAVRAANAASWLAGWLPALAGRPRQRVQEEHQEATLVVADMA
jgi:hypothetical protein